jgi:hypothetical protein
MQSSAFFGKWERTGKTVKVVITIDVEEEGLFSGRYPRSGAGVSNVARLEKLEWLTQDYGLPLTLLTDHPVACDLDCVEILRHWKERLGAEIGAHLHPWNTPPFDNGFDPLDSSSMPHDLIRAKLVSLKRAIAGGTGGTPVSFRMGRWDYSPAVAGALAEEGFLVDASIVPLRRSPAGDAWFGAPTDPFWADGSGSILEVPLTMVPVVPLFARFVEERRVRMGRKMRELIMSRFHWAAGVSIQPVWHSLACMKLAAELHRRRGGQVLTMFFHSSELLPGASPHFPTEASVAGLLNKLRAFFDWIGARTEVEGCTLSSLRGTMGGTL